MCGMNKPIGIISIAAAVHLTSRGRRGIRVGRCEKEECVELLLSVPILVNDCSCSLLSCLNIDDGAAMLVSSSSSSSSS